MKRRNDIIAAVTLILAVGLASTSGCARWGDKQRQGPAIGAAGGSVHGAMIGIRIDAGAERASRAVEGSRGND